MNQTPTDRVARHSSDSIEHYTPPEIIEFAHLTMGTIDLDPASCLAANQIVQAKQYFAREDDGFSRSWYGSVILNPPGGRCDSKGRILRPGCGKTGSCGLAAPHKHPDSTSSALAWWLKLLDEYTSGRVRQAFFVGFSLEIIQTSQGKKGPTVLDFPVCIPRSRLKFLGMKNGVLVPGSSPTHSNVLVFLPPRNADRASAVKRFLILGEEHGASGVFTPHSSGATRQSWSAVA